MDDQQLLELYLVTREQSVNDCQPLAIEDYSLQAEVFTSPPKWHLAHTSWFFETFLLTPFLSGYQCVNEAYEVLFNSYYNGVGEQFKRAWRGLLSRPTVEQTLQYRQHVDQAMMQLLDDPTHRDRQAIVERTTLGIAHEQQHQELFFTDLKYSLAVNPLMPVYTDQHEPDAQTVLGATVDNNDNWKKFDAGLVEIGFDGAGFAFDNESPRHQVYLEPFMLASTLVTNEQYQVFVDDGGYQRAEFWLSDGWTTVQQQQWTQPLYWREHNGKAMEFTLYGLRERRAQQPVCHLSGYEADAYARWAKSRLPTEAEWEWAAANERGNNGLNDRDLGCGEQPTSVRRFHPTRCKGAADQLEQLTDQCWQWTSSAYSAYPGYSPAAGAIGEYNGKFMCNQWVLRGGSCVSSPGHVRPSYRNFFYPQDRWQFSGIRLAHTL